jgi:tRNA U55 pseudouridine synthase TruB
LLQVSADTKTSVGGTLAALKRLRSGAFRVDRSLTFEQIEEKLLAGVVPLEPVESALEHLPKLHFSTIQKNQWESGAIVKIFPMDMAAALDDAKQKSLEGQAVRVYNASSEFLGVSSVQRRETCERNEVSFELRKRVFI